jgi:four helix bundle protein
MRLLYIARGSLSETKHWVGRARARQLPIPDNSEEWIDEIRRTLNGLIRRTRRNQEGDIRKEK